jgi:hypothetical protein
VHPTGKVNHVSVVGTWDVAIQTPFGEQVVSLQFSDERTGVARYGTESIGLSGVTTSNDHAAWSVALTQPIRVTLGCTVTVDGDTMSGTATAGFFGRFVLRGRRTST